MEEKEHDNDIVPEENTSNTKDSSEAGVDIDLDDSVVAEESALETVKVLKDKLKTALTERSEYLTGWQRAKADFINARKRDEESRLEFVQFANENLVSGLIPVLANFEMAMSNRESWEKVDKNWRLGVEYIAQSLRKVLEEYGLKEINPVDQMFDPNLHESVSHQSVSDKSNDGKIMSVSQKGYLLNGKVLAVPKVVVGEFKVE